MATGASPEEADGDAIANMPMTHIHDHEAEEDEEDVVNSWLNVPEDDSEATGIEHGGAVVGVAVAPIAEVAEGDSKAIGIDHGGAIVVVAVAPIAEEAEGDSKATEIEHGGAVVVVAAAVAPIADEAEDDAKAIEIKHGVAVADVAVAPIAEVVESQEKSGQAEKGKEIAAEVNPEKTIFAVGALVTCLSTRTNLYFPAGVVHRREAEAGLEYYVHYINTDKRLDEWLPSTRVNKWSSDILSPLKSPSFQIPTSPATVGSGTSPETQRDTTGTPDRRVTPNLKRRLDEVHVVPMEELSQEPKEELAPLDQSLEKEHDEKTEVKDIEVVELGKYEIHTLYHSPFPEGFRPKRLYICEFCLKYMRKKKTIEDHKMHCEHPKHPPGDEIYKTTAPILKQVRNSEGTLLENTPSTSGTESISSESVQHLSMYEVDGRKSKLYCQNLCLLSGLFLDRKELFYGVESFLFYILTENDASGNHLVAYFLKEKDSADNYNVACILTLPPFQRKGYASFLIAFAYELSKKEGKVGTPERPLTDLSRATMRRYWERVLLETLRDDRDMSIEDLSAKNSIRIGDIVFTLQPLLLLEYSQGQYYLKSDITKRYMDDLLKPVRPAPDWMKIDASKLQWAPETAPTTRRPK